MSKLYQLIKNAQYRLDAILANDFFAQQFPALIIAISLAIFLAAVVAVLLSPIWLLMALLYVPVLWFGFHILHQKHKYHLAISAFFYAFVPLCLLIFLPFHIPASYFYITLRPYGSLNPGFWAVSLSLFGFGIFHVLHSHTAYFDAKGGLRRLLFLGTIVVLGLVLRVFLIPFESDDYKLALSFWFDYIKTRGGWSALKERGFSDYNSIYLYLIALVSYVDLPKIWLIKSISILADLAGAWAVFRLVALRYGARSVVAYLAFGAVWFWPTVWLNSALWGQCDMLYTAALLWALYLLLTGRFGTACAMIGLALSIKLQSIFLVGVLAALYAGRQLKMAHLVWIPIIWLLVLVPHVLSGHSFADLLLTYPRQIVRYPALTLHAPSVWALVPDHLFGIFEQTGTLAALALVAIIFFVFWIKKMPSIGQNPELWVGLALFSCLSIPYLLPKMHERYFFAADVLALVWAFWKPSRFYVAILIGLASFGSYQFFLFKSDFFLPLGILSLLNLAALLIIGYDLIKLANDELTHVTQRHLK